MLTRGPCSHLVTLMDAAILIRDLAGVGASFGKAFDAGSIKIWKREFEIGVRYVTQFSAPMCHKTVISGGRSTGHDPAAKARLRCLSGRVVMRGHRGCRGKGVAKGVAQ
jgi:hypothetical protein